MALLNAERWDRPAIPAGTRIGRYLMGEKLAEGGMAEVYCASALGAQGFAKEVVLKIVLPALAQDEEFIDMFIAEARLASKLAHPNIVQTFDFGNHEGRYFIAMEYVRGVSLWRLRSRCRKLNLTFPPILAASICADVAKGLHHAHGLREGGQPLHVVHRDVTPHNVLLSVEGAVKLSDFGIAKAGVSHTRPGILKGKFPYMSPEQARGETVDGRTDIFALGILLWELLAGRRLFTGETDLEVLRAVQLGPISSPRAFGAHVPEELAAIALKALARPVAQRFQTAAELERELLAFVLANAKRVEDTSVAQFLLATFPPQDEFRSPIQPSTAEPELPKEGPGPAAEQGAAQSASGGGTAPMPGLPPAPKRERGREAEPRPGPVVPVEGERCTIPVLPLAEKGTDTTRLPNGRWAWGSGQSAPAPAPPAPVSQELPAESRPTLMGDAFPRVTDEPSGPIEARPTLMGDDFPLLSNEASAGAGGAAAARPTSRPTSRVAAKPWADAVFGAHDRRHAVAVGASLALATACVLGGAVLSDRTPVAAASLALEPTLALAPTPTPTPAPAHAPAPAPALAPAAAAPSAEALSEREEETTLAPLGPMPRATSTPMGRLTVHAIPFARVTVRGKLLGEVIGTKTFRLAAGTYEVQLTHPLERVARSVTIRNGAESHVELNASR